MSDTGFNKENAIRDLANTVALQAEAISTGQVIGPRWAAVRRLAANVSQLEALIPDDRSGAP